MRDPVRLVDSMDDDLGRAIVAACRTSAPPTGAKERALGAATGVLGAATLTSSGAAATTTAKVLSVVSVKWLAVTSVVGVTAVAGTVAVHELSRAPVSTQTIAASVTTSPPRPPPIGTSLSAVPAPQVSPTLEPTATQSAQSPSPAAAPLVPRAPVSATSSQAPPESSFAAELKTLDEARSAIAAGEPARALSVLDDYGVRFPRGAMAPEATVLRIQALVNAGDHAAAERAADAFLRVSPGSPYAPRIRTILGESNP